jgi:hypothetical protein
MHESLMARAVLPAPVRIYGIELLPLSLGHQLFLIRENNPLAIGGECMPADLFEAMWICSSRYTELRNARNSLAYIPKLWLLRRRAKKYNPETELKAFREYIEDGSLELPVSEMPRVRQSSEPTRPPGAPFLLRLHQFVMTHHKLSAPDAWDFPFGEAKIRWATHWEQQGGLDIYNEHEAQFDAFIAEQEAKGEKQCQA